MAVSTNTIDFQRVQVAVAGVSVALSPQPFDNTHTVIFYNRGANPLIIGYGVAGGPIPPGSGADLPVGAALTWAVGTLQSRPGAVSRLIIVDSVGGAGDVSVQLVNSISQVGPT